MQDEQLLSSLVQSCKTIIKNNFFHKIGFIQLCNFNVKLFLHLISILISFNFNIVSFIKKYDEFQLVNLYK